MVLRVKLVLLNMIRRQETGKSRSRTARRTSSGHLVQACDASWTIREREVTRGTGKRGPERRGRLVHHREPGSAREARAPRDTPRGRQTHSQGQTFEH